MNSGVSPPLRPKAARSRLHLHFWAQIIQIKFSGFWEFFASPYLGPNYLDYFPRFLLIFFASPFLGPNYLDKFLRILLVFLHLHFWAQIIFSGLFEFFASPILGLNYLDNFSSIFFVFASPFLGPNYLDYFPGIVIVFLHLQS